MKTQRATSRYGSQTRQQQVIKKSSLVAASGGLANGIEVMKCASSLGVSDY